MDSASFFKRSLFTGRPLSPAKQTAGKMVRAGGYVLLIKPPSEIFIKASVVISLIAVKVENPIWGF